MAKDSEPSTQKETVVFCRYGNLHDGEWHSCPFQYYVHNDPYYTCQCCNKCRQDCADDI